MQTPNQTPTPERAPRHPATVVPFDFDAARLDAYMARLRAEEATLLEMPKAERSHRMHEMRVEANAEAVLKRDTHRLAVAEEFAQMLPETRKCVEEAEAAIDRLDALLLNADLMLGQLDDVQAERLRAALGAKRIRGHLRAKVDVLPTR